MFCVSSNQILIEIKRFKDWVAEFQQQKIAKKQMPKVESVQMRIKKLNKELLQKTINEKKQKLTEKLLNRSVRTGKSTKSMHSKNQSFTRVSIKAKDLDNTIDPSFRGADK